MRFQFLLLTVFFFSCGQNSSTKETTTQDPTKTNTDTTKTITPSVVDSAAIRIAEFEKKLTASTGENWRVVTDSIAQWPKDVFDYFIASKRKESPHYPYVASGDFNADGKIDTAFLITNETKKNYQIAISLSIDKIVFWKEDIDLTAISKIPKTELGGINGEKIKMKGDGIEVEYYEKSSFVLYWTGNGFKRVWTSD